MTRSRYVVGVDFGTLSGRAVVVRTSDGAEVGNAVSAFAHGAIEERLPVTGQPLPADWALQDPDDWRTVLREAVPAAVRAAGITPAEVIGIAIDVTACTFLPVRADGTPLAEIDDHRGSPHAWPKLWKHHAAQPQADRVTALAEDRGEPWLARYGGRVSAEWQFAKGLQVLEEAPALYAVADRFIEAADWIVWQLTGRETRNACTAGYKGQYQDGGYPSEDYLIALHPDFGGFVRDKLAHDVSPLGARAGGLTTRMAEWTGLPAGIAVAIGNVDAHVTAPAAAAVAPGQLLAIMGTSTCHVMNADAPTEIAGICGVVDGGISEGRWGYEAGQSGVGDIFAWLLDHFVPPVLHEQARVEGVSVHDLLSRRSLDRPVGAHGLVALDWVNGNRSVLADHELSGLVLGLTMSTRAPDVYRALQEATAYGTRTIIETFERAGVAVDELIVAGGLLRNASLMQLYADVTRRPLGLIGSEQGSALGSAIHAAVAAGEYPDVYAASAVMGKVERDVYLPDPERADAYDALYEEYRLLSDHFGRGANDVMHRLRRLRNRAGDQ